MRSVGGVYAGSPKDQIAKLKAENAELRAKLELKQPITLDVWDFMPQEMRDDLAVRAIFQENGNTLAALRRLGFEVPSVAKDGRTPEEVESAQKERGALLERVFGTPGVKERMERNFTDADVHRDAIMAAQVEIAINGAPDQKIKATQNIARLQGWIKNEAPVNQTIVQLNDVIATARGEDPKRIGGSGQTALPPSADIMDILGHEPGAARRIDSESEEIDAALIEASEEDDDGERSSDDPQDMVIEQRGIE